MTVVYTGVGFRVKWVSCAEEKGFNLHEGLPGIPAPCWWVQYQQCLMECAFEREPPGDLFSLYPCTGRSLLFTEISLTIYIFREFSFARSPLLLAALLSEGGEKQIKCCKWDENHMLCFDIRVKPLLWRSLSVQLKPTWTLPAPDALLQHKMLSHTCFFFYSNHCLLVK